MDEGKKQARYYLRESLFTGDNILHLFNRNFKIYEEELLRKCFGERAGDKIHYLPYINSYLNYFSMATPSAMIPLWAVLLMTLFSSPMPLMKRNIPFLRTSTIWLFPISRPVLLQLIRLPFLIGLLQLTILIQFSLGMAATAFLIRDSPSRVHPAKN